MSNAPGAGLEPGSGFEAHLLGCPLCTAHLARQRELAAGLRRLAESLSGVKAPARVERRLLGALRAQSGVRPGTDGRRWLTALAWAATVILATGLFLAGTRRPALPGGAPAVAQGAAAEFTATVDGDEAGLETSGFIPLPNAERIGPGDDFNLVRVEVPRSTMMAVGILVSADRAAEPVEADVLLGSDGLARAVRFLD